MHAAYKYSYFLSLFFVSLFFGTNHVFLCETSTPSLLLTHTLFFKSLSPAYAHTLFPFFPSCAQTRTLIRHAVLYEAYRLLL